MHAILILDAWPLVRLGLRHVLQGAGFSQAVREASGLQALDSVQDQAPALVIVDPAQSSESGDRLVYRLRRRFPGVPVLFFCGGEAEIYQPLSLRLGISGYLSKTSDEATVAAAVRMVLAGMQCFPLQDMPATSRSRYHDLSVLSVRELAVLRLLRMGLRNKEISSRLCLSEKTVSAHKQNLFRKLGVRSVLQISVASSDGMPVDEAAESPLDAQGSAVGGGCA